MIPAHKQMEFIELVVGVISVIVLALVMPVEELIDDVIDRIARGELAPVYELLMGGE